MSSYTEEGSDEVEIIEELINIGNPFSCQYFSVEEWRKNYQLASYYWVVEIDGTEEEMDTEEMNAGKADTPIELVDLTNV